ncbi:sulfate transporter [Actinophytocola xinjiangensis]|uniref:Sulfate transporter n=1 Tax=Actinophytocola xinjiangensis TaxID=485602 RepID=A0A7Z1AVC8_9PSEU|nr:SulP family inorganic anion transporter [Actinophytocola xinjiangensis]OLF05162.1 sulfate transporter [Actinophytocola xinjiangensis]
MTGFRQQTPRRERVARVAPGFQNRRRNRRQDALAGLTGAVRAVPDGMAAAALAGVNPLHGVYAAIVGPVAGGLGSSTRLMIVSTTGAAALAAGSVVAPLAPAQRPAALVLLTLVAGVAALVVGLARLGRYLRFVSQSVVLGFLGGVAVSIVAGQLPGLLGAPAEGAVPLVRGFDVLLAPARIDGATAVVGLGALVIMVAVARTRFAVVGALVALAVPSAVVLLAGLDGVATIGDAGPLPLLPDLGLFSPDLVAGGIAVAVIVLVRGAAIGETTPNPDGSRVHADRDFLAQGAANVAAGLVGGLPVGGSAGGTALNRAAGARTRWAAVWSGVGVLAILVLFSGVIGHVALPALAAVLVVAAARSSRPGELATVLRTGGLSRLAAVTVFLAALLLPVAAAVFVGVALSLLLQLNRDGVDLRVVEVVPRADGRCTEVPVPATLTSHEITVLDVYGSLLFAGAGNLRARLPDPAGTVGAVLVLRLRGRTSLGATFLALAADYARALGAAGGRLYLSGVDRGVAESFRRAGTVSLTGPVRMFGATDVLWESAAAPYREADTWVVRHRGGG